MEDTSSLAEGLGLMIVGVVDEDSDKQVTKRGGCTVRSPAELEEMDPEGVLITTVKQTEEIRGRIGEGWGESVKVLEL